MALFGAPAPAPMAQQDFDIPMPAGADSISSFEFSPTNQLIVAGHWDNKVRCWEIQQAHTGQPTGAVARREVALGGPVLDLDWNTEGTRVFAAGCDNKAVLWDLQTGATQQVAQHNAPIKCVKFLPEMNCLITAGWDKAVRYWDIRAPKMMLEVALPERVYSMDAVHPILICAMADRKINIFNLAQPQTVARDMVSPLKFQTRFVKLFAKPTGFGIGSIEGRCSIRHVDQRYDVSPHSFAFRCHRKQAELYAVNAIAFHPRYENTFSTSGGDGTFTFWDKAQKQRLKEHKHAAAYNLAITAAKWNPAGNLFGYSLSYDWSQGVEGYNPSTQSHLVLHFTTHNEVKPKPPKGRR